VSVRHADATVLVDVARGHYFTLNAVAGRIWALVCEGAAPQAIADMLRAEYEVDHRDIRADVDAFLARLAKLALVQAE
jgi:hypothetical protein